ncbi:hypothetical protein LEMLEM_LOCUS20244, partial [Lemmus lemmus]
MRMLNLKDNIWTPKRTPRIKTSCVPPFPSQAQPPQEYHPAHLSMRTQKKRLY